MELLRSTERIMYESAKGNVRKRLGKQIVCYKYLRKFAFDTMTNEELNIPESVADFIQGRTPKSIGARHFMKFKRKAIKFYPRYAGVRHKVEGETPQLTPLFRREVALSGLLFNI
jgi:intergrase/recombinase